LTPDYVKPPSCLKPGIKCIGDKTTWVKYLREDCKAIQGLKECPTDLPSLRGLGGYVVSYKP
jgi:hypothetical protein